MKTTLFLTEQLIAIFIFAICVMICAGIFIKSYSLADSGEDLNNALLIAESAAEAYKSVCGNAEMTALLLGGDVHDGMVRVYYDKELNVCKKDVAFYAMCITGKKTDDEPASLLYGDVSVQRNDEELISFTVAARSGSK